MVFECMGRDTIENMRARIEKCRRLASQITDARAAAALRQMAEEIEVDVVKLEAEENAGSA